MPRGEGYLRQKGKVWYFEMFYNHKRYVHRIGVVPKSIAKEIAAQVRAEIIRGEYLPPKQENITFRQLAEAYKDWYLRHSGARNSTKKKHIAKLENTTAFLGNMQAHRITGFSIEQYKRWREESSSASPQTINKELAIIRAVFRKAKELKLYKGDLPSIPFYKVKEREIVRFLTPKEAQRLLEVSPLHLKRIILFALNTGCRAGEILELRWEHIDFNTNTIHIQAGETKTGIKYTIYMNSVVKQLLEEIKQEQEAQNITHGFVFTNSLGKPYSEQGYRKTFKRALEQAGIKDFRFHDLRHTFASWVAMQSKDLYLVQKLLNHKSIETTKRYAHLTQDYVFKSLEDIASVFRQGNKGNSQSA